MSALASFEDRILAEFPQAEELAWARLFTTRQQTFFDSKKHKALYPKSLIFAGLYLAHIYAARVNAELDLTVEERIVWRSTFKEKKEITPQAEAA